MYVFYPLILNPGYVNIYKNSRVTEQYARSSDNKIVESIVEIFDNKVVRINVRLGLLLVSTKLESDSSEWYSCGNTVAYLIPLESDFSEENLKSQLGFELTLPTSQQRKIDRTTDVATVAQYQLNIKKKKLVYTKILVVSKLSSEEKFIKFIT
ncbi:hypothetical protein NQ317_001472 [Molorchus minor]|uniref:Uncharacterized protein n=1 Tax=Molorchus minor TaxID=1323400 RepID=A0ABQ9JVH6_9CUCU|nr:hypothetical protein NQ317_001472 [Molorchus minor]